jgi:hypothetical protein
MIRCCGSFLIGTHHPSRKNIIECKIDGSVKNERRTVIKLIAIAIIRMISDDLDTGPKDLERIRKRIKEF